MGIEIHPTAIVHKNAQIDSGTIIGPFCIIGENVKIGKNNKFISNVFVDGHTTIGEGNTFYTSSIVGVRSQDLKDKHQASKLNIGNNNVIREFATLHLSATLEEDTNIKDNNLIMSYAHVAHNCQIGSRVILANLVQLAGHVVVMDNSSIGGGTLVHQFVKIGSFAFVGGDSAVKKDVPPFTIGEGAPYRVLGLNIIGLERKGFSSEQIKEIKEIYRLFYRTGNNFSQALQKALKMTLSKEQKMFVDFAQNSERGLTKN